MSVIAHCESTHATMARRLRSDMDEFTCNVARCRPATKEIKTPRPRRTTGHTIQADRVCLAGDSLSPWCASIGLLSDWMGGWW